MCLQDDDTEGAPLLAGTAAVVLLSPTSQVIIKDEVHTKNFPDSCDHHVRMYSMSECIPQHCYKMLVRAVHVPARVISSIKCHIKFTSLQHNVHMDGAEQISHSIPTNHGQCCCIL